VGNVGEALEALEKIPTLSRAKCRERVKVKFSLDCMVTNYEQAYARLFELERQKQTVKKEVNL